MTNGEFQEALEDVYERAYNQAYGAEYSETCKRLIADGHDPAYIRDMAIENAKQAGKDAANDAVSEYKHNL